ncbi:MAG TPA: glycosyltransferase family 4 protein [Elusimicrobiota bacterium]|nr:glycosyltransferase family 4 protein [Elusimicrobiota bacterium]
MKRIRVAHIVTLLEFGGAQQNTLHTVSHLNRDSFEPVLVCGRGAFLDSEIPKIGCPVHFVPSLVRPVRPWKDLAAFLQMRKILKRIKPDIVHTHSSKAGILGRWAAWSAGVPLIVHTFHGFGFNDEQKILSRFLFLWAERLTAPLTRCLIFVSEANRRTAERERIGDPGCHRIIRSGIPLKKYNSVVKTKQPLSGLPVEESHQVVTTIGPFKPQKNLTDFLLMAETVRRKNARARFLIVGDGLLRPLLQKMIGEKGLTDIVHLVGWRRDVPDILARTDVFVLTSLWEGLPRALLEAMASGLPSVANDVDGVSDVLIDGQTGFLIPPHSPQRTAERVLELLDRPDEMMRMGHAARSHVGVDFDIDHMVLQQETLYKELIG